MTETNPPAPRLRSGSPLPSAAAEHAVQIVADGVPGVTIVVAGDDGPLSTVDVGDITAATQYPIASTSKWLAAATVMTLVDAGTLELDLPVATWLPGGSPNAERVTLRHLLSQTSGIVGPGTPSYDLEQDHRLTMTQAATEILRHPLASEPGRVFVYGGPASRSPVQWWNRSQGRAGRTPSSNEWRRRSACPRRSGPTSSWRRNSRCPFPRPRTRCCRVAQ